MSDWQTIERDDVVVIVPCPACRGEGFIEYGHPNAPHPDYTVRCEECNGDGYFEEEAEPITLDDLDDMSPEPPTPTPE